MQQGRNYVTESELCDIDYKMLLTKWENTSGYY